LSSQWLWHIDNRYTALIEHKFSERPRLDDAVPHSRRVFGWFGYSPAVLINITVPRWGYRTERAVAYRPEPRHRMDLYLPERMAESAPAVLFFYGGAFISGHRREYRFVGQALASQGIIAGIADYGLFPDHRFPKFVEDGAKAFAFLHKQL